MQWIDSIINTYSPAVQRAASKCDAFGNRVLARLDAIHDAVQVEDMDERRAYPYAVLSAAGDMRVLTLNSDDIIEVEAVTADSATGNTTIMVDSVMRWAGSFTGAETKGGNGVVIHGPGEVAIRTAAAGMVTAQIKHIRKANNKVNTVTGDREAIRTGRTTEDTTNRHVTHVPAIHGVNA